MYSKFQVAVSSAVYSFLLTGCSNGNSGVRPSTNGPVGEVDGSEESDEVDRSRRIQKKKVQIGYVLC